MAKRVINYVSRAKREAKTADSKKLYYYEQAALKGIEVNAEIGDCYYYGWGTEPDIEKSIQYWTLAAEQGSIYAMDRLGFTYLLGRDIAVDEEKALAFLRQAFTLRYDRQDKKRYACWRNIPDRKEVFKKLRTLGREVKDRKGNVDAQFCLGVAYYLGVGIRRDVEKMEKWIMRAVEQGDVKAKDIKSDWYWHSADFYVFAELEDEYKEWFENIIKEGNYQGALCLGDLYAEKAHEKLFLCEEKYLDSEARKSLKDEKVIAKINEAVANFKKAFDYYLLANEHNIPLSTARLAECYEKGYGVEKNLEEAEKWRKVAEEE